MISYWESHPENWENHYHQQSMLIRFKKQLCHIRRNDAIWLGLYILHVGFDSSLTMDRACGKIENRLFTQNCSDLS